MRFLHRGAVLRPAYCVMVRSSTLQSLGVEPLCFQIERAQMRWLWHLIRMPHSQLPLELYQACPTVQRPKVDPGSAGEIISHSLLSNVWGYPWRSWGLSFGIETSELTFTVVEKGKGALFLVYQEESTSHISEREHFPIPEREYPCPSGPP